MIRKILLENFKCFTRDNVNLKELTIFTGINAAGKSSIIQALLIYQYACGINDNQIMFMKDIAGVFFGSPRNLVAQNACDIGDADFSISLDESKIAFIISKENFLDMKIKKYIKGEIKPLEICYLNAERIGPRMQYQAGGGTEFNHDGSNAVYLMEQADLRNFEVPEMLIIDESSRKFSHQVEAWVSVITGNVRLASKVDSERALAELKIGNELAKDPVIPTLTGFGISYELPIIIAGLWMACKGNGLLVVENPEAHLHPSAQSNMGKFLAMISKAGVQVLVETHSEHIVDGARIQSYALACTEEMLVNFLRSEDESVVIDELSVKENGELSDWPHGFFDQKQKDIRELFLQRRSMRNDELS